jgi:hypothetical protein
MTGQAWVELVRRIPATYHDCMVVLLGTGAEIVLQTVVLMEEEYMVVRGRTAGSTDNGRVFVVPFDQIEYLGFNRRITEPELRSIFSLGDAATAPPAPAPPESNGQAAAAECAPAAPAAPAAEAAPKKPAAISKTILLARLRARLAQDGKAGGS